MKIGFYANQLCGRGSHYYLIRYAEYNQTILGNESVIISKNDPTFRVSRQDCVEHCQKTYPTFLLNNLDELPSVAQQNKLDILYYIKYGTNDTLMPTDVKNCIHAVFNVNDPHGDRYFYISEWLSQINGHPYLHPILTMEKTDDDFREKFSISQTTKVFGYHGGRDSFDVKFVQKCVSDIAQKRDDVKFIFCNTDPFFRHPNIIYLPYLSELDKRKFINTCDAMLHARTIGECFGMSVAEFSMCNKPVITYTKCGDKAHLFFLKRYYGYQNYAELNALLNDFTPADVDWNFYHGFTPEKIMEDFKRVVIE